ncbi:hypothetical protein FIV42_15135 [Persicimonas caeni]|uniref:Endonuclease/exonuclease/phosphatase family protein n=1 Tax=Persicimonas caeni TaxID=2292766 RepID=A0A4Y6PUK8_PERCE|nr:hypothetical protein [Persicimonas caeni]QDG52026.1 hypothetical protein FIV42_15135 [Persicimonas caeni]QED33247.1 hypothetical protein FRD00_15130 [Persicimonas caeni]
MSRKWCWLAICLVILTTSTGCDSSNGDDPGEPDAGDLTDAADSADVVEDTDAADAGQQWPEQDQRGEDALGLEWQMPEAGDDSFSALVANVGNIDFRRCNDVAFNLCWTEMEQTIAGRIAELAPDVVLLQEVLDPQQCAAVQNPPADHACHPDHTANEPSQARRLLGADYTIVCDDRNGYECVGVRTDVGSIDGCEPGVLCERSARTAPPVEGCDEGFTLSAVTVHTDAASFDIVNGHPPSDAGGATEGRECRKGYFEHVFGPDASLVTSDKVLVGGDLNFDPFRQSEDYPDVALWSAHVGLDGPAQAGDSPSFAYHSGIVEHDPPYWTSPISKTTLDHVVSRGLIGRCKTMGAHPGLAPLDMAVGEQLERLDHLALWCQLSFEP